MKFNHISVSDDRLLRREMVNPNKFDVIAEHDYSKIAYVIAARITPGKQRIVIRSGESAILNHGFYVFTGVGLPHGEPFDLITKLGKKIGDGDGLPSRPYFE